MATLEKIRSKSVLLLVIIAVALLAFILGDFFTSGRTFFGTGTTVASIDGRKIDIMELNQRVNEAATMAGAQGRKMDNAVLQQQVLDGMIAETLYNEELEKLGITVTDQELTEAMLGSGSAYVDQVIQQQYGGMFQNAAQFHDMAFNPSKYQIGEEDAAQFRNAWIQLEKNIEEQLKQAKFQNLFMGTLVANDLDARALYDDNASTSHIAFAKKDYSTLEDDRFEVTDADIKAVYNKRRNLYRLDEPTRLIDYVSVDIAPSPEDQRNARVKVDNALTALRDNEGTSGLEGMNEFVVTREHMTRSRINDNKLKSFVDSASTGMARLVSQVGNTYTLAKLIGRDSRIDSVNIDIINIQGTRADADSALAALRSGKPFSEVSAGSKVAQAQDSLWLSLTAPDAASVRNIIEEAPAGQWFTPDTVGQVFRIFRVNNRRPAVTVYDLAQAVFVVEPSAATVNKLEADLARFVNENKTAKEFADNAAAAGYNMQTTTVSASTPRLGALDDTREAIAWAMSAKKGQVSPVIGTEANGRYVAVAIEDIYDDDFVPMTDPSLRKQLEARARNDKKAAELIKQYEGKANSIDGYAQLMGSAVDTTTVSFGQIFIPKVGINESALTAAASAAKAGKLTGPVKGNNGVIFFVVTSIDNAGRPFNTDESSMQFMQTRGAGALSRNLPAIFRGNKKVTNNSLKFYSR